jgi:hypothetical protein
MDNVFRLEPASRGDNSFACRQAPYLFPDLAAFLYDSWPTGTVDSAIHTTATHEAGVSSIDNRGGGLYGDITLN